MQLIKRQERIGELAFTIGIVIQLFLMTIGYGDYKIPFHGRLMHLAFVLFCIKIVTTYYSKKEWVVMLVLGGVGILSYIGTKDEYVVSVIVMILAAKGADMYRTCKWIFIISITFAIATAILSLLGIGGIPVDVRDYGRGGVEARWCLGFGHANNLHGTVWYIIAITIYLFFNKMDWKHYFAFTVGNIILFYFTVSKGGFIATQILIIAAGLLRYIKILAQKTWIYICGALGVAGVIIISIISVSVKWTESIILKLFDRIFTGRINLAFQYANIKEWKLLSSGGELQAAVDNGWVTVFFHYGYIIGIIFIFFHVFLIYRIWKERNGVLLAIVVTCVFYTFMESTFTMNNAYLLCNLSYIVAMILLAEKKGNGNGRKEIERNSHSNIPL